ncbi:MAG: hypothetical protein INR63_03910 [Actinomycetospora chiangmaiensis]|nr:hypothetical protein [Actinomycetospora chiangmaiensis]
MSDDPFISSAQDAPASSGTAVFLADASEVAALDTMLKRLGVADATIVSGGGAAALSWCRKHRAGILIVDLDGALAPLTMIEELASYCEPTCRLIALGGRDDINFYRALLRGGVLDYLQKPVRLDLLSAALERARTGVSADAARIGRSVAVAGCAGGQGTSSVAAALALLLSTERHIPVAVVDFDRRRSDQGLLLGATPETGLEAILGNRAIDPYLLERAMIAVNPRLRLLAQAPTWAPLEVDSEHLLQVGAGLCQVLNLVIWDLPAGCPPGVLEVLRHAELRILLTDLTLQNARTMRRLLEQVGDESDGQQILLVHNPSHGPVGSIPKAQYEDYVGRRIDLALPHGGNALRDSLLQGPLDLARCPALRQGLLDLADLACGRKPERSGGRGLRALLKQAIGRPAA